jgi:hypothetical protein
MFPAEADGSSFSYGSGGSPAEPGLRTPYLRRADTGPDAPAQSADRTVALDPGVIDVETRSPVGLLPDREASGLAARLAARPGVEVICRDRAPFFAEGATAGSPQAVQVADRWHLWHNMSEAAERAVAQLGV